MTTTPITTAAELPDIDLHTVHHAELDTVPEGWQVWQLGEMCWAGRMDEEISE